MGRNLRLRQFRIADANDLFQLHKDPILRRWLLDDRAFDSLSFTSDFLLGLQKFYSTHPGLGIWALERLECRYTREKLIEQGAFDCLEDKVIDSLLTPKWHLQGWFNLTPIEGQPQHIELGSRLHRGAWGQRIACAVGQPLVSYSFDVLGLENLHLICHPSNQPALYCAAYLGFENPQACKSAGFDALKLTATAASSQHANMNDDSKRRRAAVSCAREWSAEEVGVGA